MTCQDCIHFRDIDGGECLFACGGVPADCEINVVCEDKFENNDGSYYDGHWHCHRCGKIVEVAGLCYECDKWLMDNPIDDSWESVSK